MKCVGFIFSFLFSVLSHAHPVSNLATAIEMERLDTVLAIMRFPQTDSEVLSQFAHLALDKPVILEVLLKNGANPEVRDPQTGKTLLFSAVEGKLPISVDILLKYGADPNSRNSHLRAQTPFLLAAYDIQMGIKNRDMFLSMLNNGANLESTTTHEKNTALHFVSRDGILRDVRLLIERGAPINAQNAYGFTPLDIGAYENKKFLKAHGGLRKIELKKGKDSSFKCW